MFAGVDEMEKSQFLGNYFHWMRNVFLQVKRQDVTPLLEKEERPVELEPIVASDLQIRDSSVAKEKKNTKGKKSGVKKNNSLVQGKTNSENEKPLADFDDAEKRKRRRALLGDELNAEKPRPHPKSKKIQQ